MLETFRWAACLPEGVGAIRHCELRWFNPSHLTKDQEASCSFRSLEQAISSSNR